MITSLTRTAVALVASFLICFLTVTFLVQPVTFQGTSMLPALHDGDRMFIQKSFWKPQRGDIVAFYYPIEPSKSYIKRIVGLPGEMIEIDEGRVSINGKFFEESYVERKLSLNRQSLAAQKIPNRQYFVLGDNRDGSNDSRMFGPVPEELIYGKYVMRYWTSL